MRTLLLVPMVLMLCAAAQAKDAPGTVEAPITKKNWRKHPRIVEVRKVFEANEAAQKSGALKSEDKPVCEQPALETERTAWRDAQGRIRKYVTGGGSDDSAYTIDHHYDEQGRLRFVYARSGAVNDSSMEHRLYFTTDGKLLWHDRKASGVGYPWMEGWPESHVERDAEKAWRAKPRDCPKGREL